MTLSSLRKFKSSSCERGLFFFVGLKLYVLHILDFLGVVKGEVCLPLPDLYRIFACTCFVTKQPRTFRRVHRSIISSASTNNPFVMRTYKAFECCELLEIKERSLGATVRNFQLTKGSPQRFRRRKMKN